MLEQCGTLNGDLVGIISYLAVQINWLYYGKLMYLLLREYFSIKVKFIKLIFLKILISFALQVNKEYLEFLKFYQENVLE